MKVQVYKQPYGKFPYRLRVKIGQRWFAATTGKQTRDAALKDVPKYQKLVDMHVSKRRIPSKELSFSDLRDANVDRCAEVWHPLHAWNVLEWGAAAAGELGEALNLAKKIFTGRYGGEPMSSVAITKLGHELANAIIYIDLMAARMGIDLAEAVKSKFNQTSHENKCDITLGDPEEETT